MSTSTTNTYSDPNATRHVETVTGSGNVGPVPEHAPMMHTGTPDMNKNIQRDINKDTTANQEVTNLSEPSESKGIVSSVMDAAMLAANRVREAFVGENVDTSSNVNTYSNSSERDREFERDRQFERERLNPSDKTTTEKIKDTAYDAKEKIKDTAYDAKEKIKDTAYDIQDKIKDTNQDIKDKTRDTSRDMQFSSNKDSTDIKNQVKDTAYDVKNQVKDTAHDIRNQSKDTAYDIKDKSKDTAHDVQYDADNTIRRDKLSADSDIAADSSMQKLRDVKEKVMDAAKAPVVMLQTALAAGRDRMQEAMQGSSTTTSNEPIRETPGTADMFSENYQPVQYKEESTTEQAKTKLADAAANVADKAESWIAENKHKPGEQASKAESWIADNRGKASDRAQELASDARQKANEAGDKAQALAADAKQKATEKAQESGKEPASDTRYYSGVHGQTY